MVLKIIIVDSLQFITCLTQVAQRGLLSYAQNVLRSEGLPDALSEDLQVKPLTLAALLGRTLEL